MTSFPREIPPVTTQTPVGWIGTGVMGHSMCAHLLALGFAVSIFTRTKERAQPLLDRGGGWAPSSRDVAEHSQIVCTMVGYPAEVRAAYFGKDGVLAGAHPGTILIDFTTTEPSLSREIAAEAASRGVYALDAPVSGGDVGARNATLSIMVGGEKAAFDAARPLLELVGKSIIRQGGPGAGQHAKMCNQIVIASTMIGVCECLLYGHKAGLDLEVMLQSIRGGAAGCWTLDNLAPRILKRNFDPGFFVDHFVKDMSIALDEARRMNLALPGLALVHEMYIALAAQGHGKKGTHALMLALEHFSSARHSIGVVEPVGVMQNVNSRSCD